MLLGLEFTPSTVVVLALVVAWAVWAVRRLWRNGMCDSHADSPRGCSGGCGGCSGCGAAARMSADMQKALAGKPVGK